MIRPFFTLWGLRIWRDYRQLAAWTLIAGALPFFATTQLSNTFDTTTDREAVVRISVANPTFLIVRGIPQGDSLEALVFFQLFTYIAILVALMSSFLAVRHSRAEEESERADLISATPAGRHVPTFATVVHGVVAIAVMSAAITTGLALARLPFEGSLVTGLAAAMVGLVFLSVGLLAAQFMHSARGANGITLAVLGVAFLLRAAGDASGTASTDGLSVESAWPSWLSFIGWGQQTHAFTGNNLGPLALGLGFSVVVLIAVFILQSVRDTGASFFPARRGRSRASRTLTGVYTLAWRLQWTTVVSWCVAGAIFGLFAPALSPVIKEATGSNPAFQQVIRSLVPSLETGSIDDLFMSLVFQLIGVLAALCATQLVLRLRRDEVDGTLEELLATPLHRTAWYTSHLCVAALATALILASAALASSVGFVFAGETKWDDAFETAAAQFPAAAVFLAITAALFVVVPLVVTGLGWGIVAAGAFVAIYGGLIGLADWVRDLSPFAHTPSPLADSPDWSGAWVMLALAVVLLGLATWLMRHREIGQG